MASSQRHKLASATPAQDEASQRGTASPPELQDEVREHHEDREARRCQRDGQARRGRFAAPLITLKDVRLTHRNVARPPTTHATVATTAMDRLIQPPWRIFLSGNACATAWNAAPTHTYGSTFGGAARWYCNSCGPRRTLGCLPERWKGTGVPHCTGLPSNGERSEVSGALRHEPCRMNRGGPR
jgi:hypothetical protein